MNLSLKTGFILDSFTAIGDKLFSEFLYLISFLFELLNRLTLTFDHLFEVIALKNKIRNGLLIVGFIDPTNFD
jgi:hypothetical protein